MTAAEMLHQIRELRDTAAHRAAVLTAHGHDGPASLLTRDADTYSALLVQLATPAPRD